MRIPALVVAASLLASCSLVNTARETLQRANETLEAGKQLVNEGKAAYVEAKAAADKDGDGKTSIPEWLQWLLGGGGLAGIYAAVKRAKTQKELDERYDQVRPPAAPAGKPA